MIIVFIETSKIITNILIIFFVIFMGSIVLTIAYQETKTQLQRLWNLRRAKSYNKIKSKFFCKKSLENPRLLKIHLDVIWIHTNPTNELLQEANDDVMAENTL